MKRITITLDDELLSMLNVIVRSQVPDQPVGVSWQDSMEYAIRIAYHSVVGENKID